MSNYTIKTNDRVQATSLDIKNNGNKSELELFRQLQNGNATQLQVRLGSDNINSNNQFVIKTQFGSLELPGNLNLKIGDNIELTIFQKNDSYYGNITKINQMPNYNNSRIEFKPANNMLNFNPSENLNHADNLNEYDLTPFLADSYFDLPARLTYLKLDKLDQNSKLYQILSQATNDSELLLKLANDKSVLSHQFEAVVSSSNIDNIQSLKTKFGVISIKDSDFAIGSRINLELLSINGMNLNIPIIDKISNLIKFINLNRQLAKKNNSNNFSKSSILGFVEAKNSYGDLENLDMNFKFINQSLSNNNFKDIIYNIWNNIPIPFLIDNEIIYHDFELFDNNYDLLHFKLEIELRDNLFRFDGRARYKGKARKIEYFELNIKTKKPLTNKFENNLSKIFNNSKSLAQVNGNITFGLIE